MTLAIRCRELTKVYGSGARATTAVDHLDLEIPPGTCLGLLGPNGAGKTTTVEMIIGLQQPTAGALELFGQTWDTQRRSLSQRIGMSLQDAQLPSKLTVLETTQMFRGFYRKGYQPREVLARLGLQEIAKQRVSKLSGGQHQRLLVACALVGNPELLCLDEPTAGLDPHARHQVWDMIRDATESGRTVVLTTHAMEEAQRLCDIIALLHRGRLIALGSPQQLIAQHGASHVLRFSVSGGQALPVEDLCSIQTIESVVQEAESFRVTVTQLHRALPALVQLLEERQLTLTHLATESLGLEEVFVKLTPSASTDTPRL